jgi:hypothetical protein
MTGKREKDPFIQKGDEVHIYRPGGLAGLWKVATARYMSRDESDPRIEMVLSKGGGMMFKIKFDEKSMRVRNNTPDYMLSRDIAVKKPLSLKPKEPRP